MAARFINNKTCDCKEPKPHIVGTGNGADTVTACMTCGGEIKQKKVEDTIALEPSKTTDQLLKDNAQPEPKVKDTDEKAEA